MRYVKGSVTSFDAAVHNLPKAGTQRRQILDAIRAAGDFGLTRDELEVACGLSGNAVRPRVRELQDEGHIEEDTEQTRRTRSGSQATVLVAKNVGSSTEDRDQAEPSAYQPVDADFGVASGVADEPSFPSEDYSAPPATSMYDCWESAA